MVSVPVGEVPEAVARVARPIHGDDEIDQLLDLLADANIVLLGEATHGTHEFYELRAQLTRRLIEHHGFAAVAIEGDWPDALRVDRYVRHQSDDESAEHALASFERFPTWMWRNLEVAEFVDWLHHHNRDLAPTARAGFYGLDLYSLHASMQAVLSYLDDVDPALAHRARERYACFDQLDPQQYGLHAHLGMRDDCEEEVLEQLVEMQRRRAARSGRSPSGAAWFHAFQNARVVKDAEAYYRTMFAGRTASWNLRDTHMADTVDMLREQLATDRSKPAKLVVWAHNSHVGDARATELGDDGEITLGQILRMRYPDEVALLGFTTHDGTVECATDWDEPPMIERVRPSLPGSWEELFHATELARFFITSTALKRHVGENVRRLHRAIGVVYRPDTERRSHYYHARLADQYDVIVHLDTTRAVTPLDKQASGLTSAETHEMPETFPTGI
jgi:erythromycin esterase-like protein